MKVAVLAIAFIVLTAAVLPAQGVWFLQVEESACGEHERVTLRGTRAQMELALGGQIREARDVGFQIGRHRAGYSFNIFNDTFWITNEVLDYSDDLEGLTARNQGREYQIVWIMAPDHEDRNVVLFDYRITNTQTGRTFRNATILFARENAR